MPRTVNLPTASQINLPTYAWLLSDVIDEGNALTAPTSPLTGATFDIPPQGCEFESPKFSHTSDETVTFASASRAGGTSITAESAESMAFNGNIPWIRTNVIAQSDTDVKALVDRVLLTHKDVLSRITEVTIRPLFSDAAMWMAAMCELNDTVRIRLTSRGLDRFGYIIGIRHSMNLQLASWTLTLTITEGGQ